MRVLLQRVSRGAVRINGTTIADTGRGYVLLTGVAPDDTVVESASMAKKIVNLRLFEDADGSMNRSALDLLESGNDNVSMLVVSQFTLYADCRKGRRPSFVGAARPDHAESIVADFAHQLQQFGIPVSTGQFGAMMEVDIVNDGPVTIWLDSTELKRPKSRASQSADSVQGIADS